MTIPIAIRPWRPGDEDGLRRLIPPIQCLEFGLPISWAEQPDLHDVAGFYGRGGGGFWVAEVRRRIVGSIALVDIGGGDGALRKMFVARDWRGPETGIAGRLLDGLLEHALDRGMQRIWLGTTEAFKAAHRYYGKHGFVEVAAAERPPAFPRMAVDTRFYRLDLAAQRTSS